MNRSLIPKAYRDISLRSNIKSGGSGKSMPAVPVLALKKEPLTSATNAPGHQQPNATCPIAQKIANGIVQRVKFAELEMEDRDVIKTSFGLYLRNNYTAQFGSKKPADIVAEIKRGTDYPDLKKWITDFKATSTTTKESSPFASSSSSAMIEKPLPETLTHEGTHVSFSTNVKSGIDGMFDLWYYHNLSVLDVDVKFGFTQEPTPDEYLTLKSMEKFWTNRFCFRNKSNLQKIHIDINIMPVPAVQPHHFKYTSVSGDVNPNVLRPGQQFSTRTIKEDTTAGSVDKQISAHHEFGHVLGLGEEYGLKGHARNSNHHFKMAEEVGLRLPSLSGDEESVPGSVMGHGNLLQPQHYAGILTSFARLVRSTPAAWEIIKE